MNLSMAVVVRQGTVLIQQRYRVDVGTVYEFPGGKVDTSETYVQTAMRELREETGLLESNPVHTEILPSDNGGKVAFVVFDSENKHGPLRTDSSRQQEFFWFKPAEIPLDDFHDADKLFIEKLLPGLVWIF